MLTDQTRRRLDALLGAISARPNELPLGEVVDLATEPVSVAIERRAGEVLVLVRPRDGAAMSDERFDALSPREREVAALLADGLSNAEIATALFISLGTVKDHVHAVLSKTGLRSRAAVAAAWHGQARPAAPSTS